MSTNREVAFYSISLYGNAWHSDTEDSDNFSEFLVMCPNIVAIFTSTIFKSAFGVGRYVELAVPLLIIIIGISEWPKYARTVRASILGEKIKDT